MSSIFSKKGSASGLSSPALPSNHNNSMLSPRMPSHSSSASSPIQSATSPRLMPSKSRPTTAVIFEPATDPFELPPTDDSHHLVQSIAAAEGIDALSLTGREKSKWRPRAGSHATTMTTDLMHANDDNDGRLTDTESDLASERASRVGTPVIMGRPMTLLDASNGPQDRDSPGFVIHEEVEEEGSLSHGQATTQSDSSLTLVNNSSAGNSKSHSEKLERIRQGSSSSGRPSSKLKRTDSTKSYDSDDISNNNGGYQKHYGDEDPTSKAWASHRKHFFILSSAGKPIYARYGDESRISSYMGVIQAIISLFADNEDQIRCINAGVHKFVFLLKAPLYLLCVSRTGESEVQLRDQLGYLYNQIISVLTHSQMSKIFETRNNFDLRGLIGGTEIFLDSLGKLMNTDPGFMLGAVQCLTMPRELRDKIGSVLGSAKSKSLLYSILLTPTQLITLLRPRTHSMHPSDLHLIFNLLSGSSTFEGSESWTPICLPKFNNKSFLHAYICYIAKRVCMVLISPDKDCFFEMSEIKSRVVASLESAGILSTIESYAAAGIRGGFTVGDTSIPGLRHFLYKSKTNVQFTMPEVQDPYTSQKARKRLFYQYQHIHERMHRRGRPLKLLFHVGQNETMLGWITSGFELYAAFGPLVSKSAVVLISNKLLKWIRKQEDRLMILSSPSFDRY